MVAHRNLTGLCVRKKNEEAVGGLRNAARSVLKVPGWHTVGTKISAIILTLADESQVELSKVLDNLGNKNRGVFGARSIML